MVIGWLHTILAFSSEILLGLELFIFCVQTIGQSVQAFLRFDTGYILAIYSVEIYLFILSLCLGALKLF